MKKEQSKRNFHGKEVHRVVGNCAEFCKLAYSDHLMLELIIACLVDVKKNRLCTSRAAFDARKVLYALS